MQNSNFELNQFGYRTGLLWFWRSANNLHMCWWNQFHSWVFQQFSAVYDYFCQQWLAVGNKELVYQENSQMVLQEFEKQKFDPILEMQQEGQKVAPSWGQLGGEEVLAATAGGNCSLSKVASYPMQLPNLHIKSWQFSSSRCWAMVLAWAWSWPRWISFQLGCEIYSWPCCFTKFTKIRQIQDDLHFSLPTSCTCPDGSQPEVSRLKINFSIRLCRSQRKLFPAKNPNVLNPDSSQRGSGWPAEGKGGKQVSWRNSFGIEWYWANFLSAVLNEGLSRSAEAEQFWDRIIFSGENLDQFSYHQYSARRTHVGRETK